MTILTAWWTLDAIIIILSLLCYFILTKNYKYWKKLNVMQIPPNLIFGNFTRCFFMKESPGDFLRYLYNKAEGLPYAGFYIFNKPAILIRDPEIIKQVLVKDFNYFTDKYASADETDRLGYTNLFIIKNPAWKLLRTKLTPIFTTGRLKNMFELMIDVGKDLDVHLASLSLEGKGQIVEVKDLCAKLATDFIGTTAYGLKVNCLNNPDAEFRYYGKKIFECTIWRGFEILSMFFMPSWIKLLRSKFFGKESSEFIRRFFWDTINKRISSGIKRNDLFDLLIELKKTHENDSDLGGFRFEGDDLVAQAAVFFTAGFETTSTTLSFTLYELALNPDIQIKLRKIIVEKLEETNGKISLDMITNIPYLDMVVFETLRKYPAFPFLDRIAGDNYKIPNFNLTLAKGTPVYVSTLGLHYDPNYYPAPNKYDPERFNEENKANRSPFVHLPFGEGPRMCIGLRLGLLETKLGIIHILRQYELLPCEKTMIPMHFNPNNLLTTALAGVHLTIKKL